MGRFSPTVLTTRCERISKDSRRSGPIGVFVITGASACAVNTRRRPDDAAALLVSPRRREANLQRHSLCLAVAFQRHLSFGPKDILSFTRWRLFPCLFSTHLLFQLILRFRGKLKSP